MFGSFGFIGIFGFVLLCLVFLFLIGKINLGVVVVDGMYFGIMLFNGMMLLGCNGCLFLILGIFIGEVVVEGIYLGMILLKGMVLFGFGWIEFIGLFGMIGFGFGNLRLLGIFIVGDVVVEGM